MNTLKSWDDWFRKCGEEVENVKQYEDLVFQFYKKLFPKDKQKQQNKFYSPFNTGFYKKESFTTSIPYLLKNILLLFICVFAGIFLFFTIRSAFVNGQGDNLFESLANGFKLGIVDGLIYGAIISVVFVVIYILIKFLSLNGIKNKLKKQEEKLDEFIRTIPPKYRNYECLSFISALFFEYPYVTFNQAIDSTDDYIRENRIRNIKGIMYDTPYGSLSLTENIQQKTNSSGIDSEKNDEDKQEILNNPNLPQDIQSKLFNGSEDAQSDLNKMIGLDDVKKQIERLKNRIQFYGSDSGNSGNHMVFMGSAGSGKTTVARIITKILYDFGYIKKNTCVEIDGDYLKSPYIGQTGERTSAIIDFAMGGVLFIDEAYLLYDKNSTSAEATGVLLKAMEDRRKDFVVILAGYEGQMTKLLASNEGFASRIKHKIIFPDYTVDEMYKIFTLFLNNYHENRVYLIDEDAKQLLLKNFEQEKKSKSFGNARTVRNAVDGIMDYHADRMVSEGRKSDTNQITIEDVRPYVELRDRELKQDIRNTAASNQLDESIIRLSDLKQKMKVGSENYDIALRNLIGLDDIKQSLDLLKKQKEFYEKDIKVNNFVLIGNDELAKETFIPILTGFLYDNGFIRDNRYLDLSAEFLKGSYVGHTPRRTEAIIQYAKGGVLYLKNINLLSSQKSTDSFGQEALTVLSSMFTNKDDLIIILSDTKENIEQFYRNNPEIFNSVEHELYFKDYTSNEQLQMFNILAKEHNFTIEESCLNKLKTYFEQNENKTTQFVHNLFANIEKKHISNYTTGDNKFVLTENDFNDIFVMKPEVKKMVFKFNKKGD